MSKQRKESNQLRAAETTGKGDKENATQADSKLDSKARAKDGKKKKKKSKNVDKRKQKEEPKKVREGLFDILYLFWFKFHNSL